jgi:chromatin remodeling complex protein RSC6
MVRKTTTKTDAPVATPTVTVTVDTTPVVEKKPKAEKKAKAVATPAPVETPVVAPVAVETPTVETTVDASTLASKLNDFGSKIQQVTTILSSMKADYKLLEKSVSRELKAATKSKKAKKASSGNRQPSGFVKPSVISDELITFLGKEAGTMMSRVEVSKGINAYITANSLKDKVSGRQINPDAKLATLLKIGKDEVLTYFNLQKYLKIHFIKATSA